MRINSAGSTNINLLQSDAFTFRNEDYVTSMGGAFFEGINLPAVGGSYSKSQLYNPSGSGVTLILDSIYAMSDTSTNLAIAGTSGIQLTASSAGTNKNLGGSTSAGRRQYEITGTSVSGGSVYIPVSASVPTEISFPYPVIIGENRGLFVRPLLANESLDITFFWREV